MILYIWVENLKMNVVYLLKLAKGNLKPYGIQVQDNVSCL